MRANNIDHIVSINDNAYDVIVRMNYESEAERNEIHKIVMRNMGEYISPEDVDVVAYVHVCDGRINMNQMDMTAWISDFGDLALSEKDVFPFYDRMDVSYLVQTTLLNIPAIDTFLRDWCTDYTDFQTHKNDYLAYRVKNHILKSNLATLNYAKSLPPKTKNVTMEGIEQGLKAGFSLLECQRAYTFSKERGFDDTYPYPQDAVHVEAISAVGRFTEPDEAMKQAKEDGVPFIDDLYMLNQNNAFYYVDSDENRSILKDYSVPLSQYDSLWHGVNVCISNMEDLRLREVHEGVASFTGRTYIPNSLASLLGIPLGIPDREVSFQFLASAQNTCENFEITGEKSVVISAKQLLGGLSLEEILRRKEKEESREVRKVIQESIEKMKDAEFVVPVMDELFSKTYEILEKREPHVTHSGDIETMSYYHIANLLIQGRAEDNGELMNQLYCLVMEVASKNQISKSEKDSFSLMKEHYANSAEVKLLEANPIQMQESMEEYRSRLRECASDFLASNGSTNATIEIQNEKADKLAESALTYLEMAKDYVMEMQNLFPPEIVLAEYLENHPKNDLQSDMDYKMFLSESLLKDSRGGIKKQEDSFSLAMSLLCAYPDRTAFEPKVNVLMLTGKDAGCLVASPTSVAKRLQEEGKAMITNTKNLESIRRSVLKKQQKKEHNKHIFEKKKTSREER